MAILRHDVVSSTVVPRGELIVGTLTSLLAYLAAPALAGFREKYPEVSFRIIEGTSKAMRDAVAKGLVDIAFISLIEGQDDLEVCPLLSEQLFLVGHRDAGLEIDKPVSLSALQHTPLILTARPNGLRIVVDRALGRLGSEGNVAFEVETLLLAIQLAQLKQGFTVFPYCAIDEIYSTGRCLGRADRGDAHVVGYRVFARAGPCRRRRACSWECVQQRSKEKVLAGHVANRHADLLKRAPARRFPVATGLTSVPIPSISISQVSPASRYRGGLRENPTPSGVPVVMTSPGASGMKDET